MIKLPTRVLTLATFGLLLCVSVVQAQWQTQWQAGAPGRGWPIDGVGGGPDVDFLQENGVINPLPGSPTSGTDPQTSDNDYYFAGDYPQFNVPTDETGAERAFGGGDLDLRFHFNLPSTLDPEDKFRFSFEAENLHEDAATHTDPRFGVQVSFNGTLIMPEIVIRPAELRTIFTSVEFTAADVGAIGGPGADNVVSVGGISYNADNGGNWMGMDYHHLEVMPIPEPGSFCMLLAGLFWLLPIVWAEKKRFA